MRLHSLLEFSCNSLLALSVLEISNRPIWVGVGVRWCGCEVGAGVRWCGCEVGVGVDKLVS